MIQFFVILSAIGGAISLFQELLTLKFKDNVKLNLGQLALQFFVAITGLVFVMAIHPSVYNTLLTDKCSKLEQYTPDQIETADLIFSLKQPAQSSVAPFKIILSIIIFESSITLILML